MDRIKVGVIERLSLPDFIRAVRSYLNHAGFCRIFIKDFLNVTKYLCALLSKVVAFIFVDAHLETFNKIKKVFTSTPIVTALD